MRLDRVRCVDFVPAEVRADLVGGDVEGGVARGRLSWMLRSSDLGCGGHAHWL
jgi:hypothetical protein